MKALTTILCIFLASILFAKPDLEVIDFKLEKCDTLKYHNLINNSENNYLTKFNLLYRNSGDEIIKNFVIKLEVYEICSPDSTKLISSKLIDQVGFLNPNKNYAVSKNFIYYGNPSNKIFQIILNPLKLNIEKYCYNNFSHIEKE
jgi:hypothetical protein